MNSAAGRNSLPARLLFKGADMLDFKNKITGGFDLLLLFGRGIKKFSGTKKEALVSVILPLALFPCSLAFSYLYPPKGMEVGYEYPQIAATITAQFILSFIFSNALVMGLSRLLDRGDKFWLFFSAGNWASVALFIVTVPFMIAAASGIVGREEMDRIFVLVSCYSYVVTACIAWRAFSLNWQLAGVVAIATLFVNQELWHFIYSIQNIPIPW